MRPVIQDDNTGCAIACDAAITGKSYIETKKIAGSLGIHADDVTLWSDTGSICELLAKLGIATETKSTPFTSWESLPNCALLSIKWHMEQGKPYWHWVVFCRDGNDVYVLDSKATLKENIRTDFGRMNPKWYIEVGALYE